MCVRVRVPQCVREILAQVQSWNSLGFPIPAVVVTAFLVHIVSIGVFFLSLYHFRCKLNLTEREQW